MNVDVIALELLRQKIEAICEEGGTTIQHTAICPIVTEAGDFSLTLLDAEGRLLAGGGHIIEHFYAATNVISAIRRKHAEICDGDVFIANDPHNGGGLHPQDVFICRPIVQDGECIAWSAASAHMMDTGGMAPGSFAPKAQECYGEALLLPPIHLIRAGTEQEGIWDIIRNNIRFREYVEMDLRSLIAGTHVAAVRVREMVANMGIPYFQAAAAHLCERTRQELQRRIGQLEEGTYWAVDWVEFGAVELHKLVCTLTVSDSKLIYDFSGSALQTNHWHNSHDFIIRSGIGRDLSAVIAQDLPFNQGLFDAFEVIAPKGSIVNAVPPAPVGVGHLDVTYTATELAVRTLMMAMMASPGAEVNRLKSGPGVSSAYTSHLWTGLDRKGEPTAFVFVEGLACGTSAAPSRDGADVFTNLVGSKGYLEYPDIEVLESWYPIQVDYRRNGLIEGGAGEHRGGARMEMAYRLDGTDVVTGVTLGGRTRLPQSGIAGGLNGSVASFVLESKDGTKTAIAPSTSELVLTEGDVFIFKPGSGGGWGDPLLRDAHEVEADVSAGKMTASAARALYGVAVGDPVESTQLRKRMLESRLQQARPAKKNALGMAVDPHAPSLPLFDGVVQRGNAALSERTGATLAMSPDPWTDGCPTIDTPLDRQGDIRRLDYLDPLSGHYLASVILAEDVTDGFGSIPVRWLEASAARPMEGASMS